MILEDGVTLPDAEPTRRRIAREPAHPLTSARADLLKAMREQNWPEGRNAVEHRWKHASILCQAYRHGVPCTVHPGIGYDIISNHPVFSGSAIGRAGEWDFKLFGGSVEKLEGGVVLSVGSAIMGPQVFEKSRELREQPPPAEWPERWRTLDLRRRYSRRRRLGLDAGEPPKTNPAYYLRFCKSYSRMGGAMHYVQCDNLAFVHHLYRALSAAG